MPVPKNPKLFQAGAFIPKVKEVHRIALLCYGGIGDVLLFSPVLAELKAALPHTHLTLYVEERSATVATVLPHVDVVLTFPSAGTIPRWRVFQFLLGDLRKRYFDAALTTGTHPALAVLLALSGIPYKVGYASPHRWSQGLLSVVAPYQPNQYAAAMHFELARTFLKGLLGPGYTQRLPQPLLPQLVPPQGPSLEAMQAVLAQHQHHMGSRKHLLLHPGVSQLSLKKGINKTWKAGHWAQLILQLSTQHAVFLVGGPDDTELITEIQALIPEGVARFANLHGQTKSFRDLAALMSLMDAVVCVDSSPLHLAVGLGKPTVALFGPTDEAKLLPQGVPWVKAVVRGDVECRPCLWAVRQRNCEHSTCLDISPEAVNDAVEALLAQYEQLTV
jgi:ADP-heptose:LPS heptosyltransferase